MLMDVTEMAKMRRQSFHSGVCPIVDPSETRGAAAIAGVIRFIRPPELA